MTFVPYAKYSGNQGLRCLTCDTASHWRDLLARVEDGCIWVWSCPVCLTDLRADEYGEIAVPLDGGIDVLREFPLSVAASVPSQVALKVVRS